MNIKLKKIYSIISSHIFIFKTVNEQIHRILIFFIKKGCHLATFFFKKHFYFIDFPRDFVVVDADYLPLHF
jgi:hypothetical protein